MESKHKKDGKLRYGFHYICKNLLLETFYLKYINSTKCYNCQVLRYFVCFSSAGVK